MTGKKNKQPSQKDLLMEYFKENPNRDISHPEIVDWATEEWQKRTGEVFRDPDRDIRSLHQEGQLIKVEKGVYRYDPAAVEHQTLEDFTPAQKEAILERGDYKCAICGLGEKDGESLHVDHMVPKDKGGKATIENGQALCSKHNIKKKNYGQTESGKKMFINLYDLAKNLEDEETQKFCEDVLRVYKEHDMNGHIKWKE